MSAGSSSRSFASLFTFRFMEAGIRTLIFSFIRDIVLPLSYIRRAMSIPYFD